LGRIGLDEKPIHQIGRLAYLIAAQATLIRDGSGLVMAKFSNAGTATPTERAAR
jgi:hypothetical protein